MPATNPGTANLIACYELEEAIGTRSDAHGSADLTDGSSVGSNTGVVGDAVYLRAISSDHLYRTSDTALDVSGGDFSICFWMKLASLNITTQILVRQGAGNTRSYNFTMLNSNVVRFAVSSGASWSYADHGTTLSSGTWYFVYGRFDDSANLIYVNVYGQTEASAFFSGTLYSGSNNFYLGSTPTPSAYFDGYIDQLMLFNDYLTNDEVDWLYNSGSGRAYADFSSGSGLSIPVAMATYRRRRSGVWSP